MNGVAGAADTVDTAEALDDANGIPVDVIVDEVVAVLKVLAFADAVGGDEEVDLTLLRHGRNLGAVLGAWGKVGENLVVSARAEGGAGVAAAADEGQVDAEFLARPVEQRVIEVGAVSANAVKTRTFRFGSPSLFVVGLATLAAMSFLSSASLASVAGVTSRAAL